ncbi:MAG: sodium-dependent transporter [Phycisphaeraceae bacterium]
MADQPALKQRDQWSGRGAFILAAIGSAVGLGNLWGFPYKLYTFGGAAFLIPYFLAMLVMGVPLLIMEFSVGHWAQQSPPGAFRKVLGRYKFVGWWLVVVAFVIITYYTVVLSWCLIYLWQSIVALGAEALPWAGGVDQAGAHFNNMVGLKDGASAFEITGMQWWVLVGALVSWLLIYLSLFKGVKWVSKVVLITVPLPWLMLVVLTIHGMTQEGAIGGLEFYLEPRWDKLAEAQTWRWAFGQVFFSMSLGFAVMLSYASFLHRRSDLNNNAMIIGLGDLATSFIAGIAVFSTLGGMSFVTGASVENVVNEGPGLAFVAFPYALGQLPYAAFFSLIFFAALLTLGIDSGFSIVEAVLASIDDNSRLARGVVLPIICVIGALISVIYCFGHGGLSILSLADEMINGPFGILIVAMAECVIVGWAWRGSFVKRMREHANDRSDWKLGIWWDWIIRYIAPALLAILFVWSLSEEVVGQLEAYKAATASEPYAWPWAKIGGFAIFILIPFACWAFAGRNTDRVTADRQTGAVHGVIYTLIVMAVATVGVGLAQYHGWLEPSEAVFEADNELSLTAYAIVTAAMFIIFGGLAWCFWRAMLAAGTSDVEIQDEPSI